MDGKPEEPLPDSGRSGLERPTLLLRAEAGNPFAQVELARTLREEEKNETAGISRNAGEADRWRLAAERNPLLTDDLRVELGRLAETAGEKRKAVSLFLAAARNDHAGAEFELGRMTLSDAVMRSASPEVLTTRTSKKEASSRRAVRWFFRAWEHGNDEIRRKAAKILGKLYNADLSMDSRGGPTFRNVPRSLVWFRRAARLGSVDAKIHLIEVYRLGTGVLRNDDKAKSWFVDLFGPNVPFSGRPRVTLKQGNRFVFRQLDDFGKKAAEMDETVEQAVLTIRNAVSEESVRQAMDALKRLCRKGFAPAIVAWVAEVYDMRQWSRWREADFFLRDAVRQGFPDALALEGRRLLTGGLGVRQDIPRARALLASAAEAGSVAALVELGDCARRGLGERKDPDKAKRLLEEAGEQGNGRGWFLRALAEETHEAAVASGRFRNAEEAGCSLASRELAQYYRRRAGTDGFDNVEDIERGLKKDSIRGDAEGQYEYGMFLMYRHRWPEAAIQFENALSGGFSDAGVWLGWMRLRGTQSSGRSSVRRDWPEAERLFRRHCPFSRRTALHLNETVLEHFLSKPRRTDRDLLFLGWAKTDLAYQNPELGATLFRNEDPDFAISCRRKAESRPKEPSRFRTFRSTAEQAEEDWNSGDDVRRNEAGQSFVKLAEEAETPAFRTDFDRTFGKKGSGLNSEKRIEWNRFLARCFWQAAQTLIPKGDLQKDERPKDEQALACRWSLHAVEPFFWRDIWSGRVSPPPFVLKAALHVWKNGKQAGVADKMVAACRRIAATLGDRDALLHEAQSEAASGYTTRLFLGRAVKAGIPAALRMKAERILADADPGPAKTERAAELLRTAADGGDPEAQCQLGEKLRDEAASDDDRRRAVAWFGKAAENGHGRGMLLLGRCLLDGFGTERNAERALQLFKRAAIPLQKHASVRAEANFEIGRLLLAAGKTKNAVNHLLPAAENGNKDAMAVLALDDRLRGPFKDDDFRAWCKRVLELPPDDARLRGRVWTRLGRIPDGFGTVDAQRKRSAGCFRRAAEAGDGPGAYEWARCLLFGDGVPRNRRQAEKWFREAAERCKGLEGDDGKLADLAGAWLKTALFD